MKSQRFLRAMAMTAIAGAVACQPDADNSTVVLDSPALSNPIATPKAALPDARSALQKALQADRLLHHEDVVTELYRERDFEPIWTTVAMGDTPEFLLSMDGESLLATLLEVEDVHALWIEDFHIPTIRRLLGNLNVVEDAVELDILLTDAVARYADVMRFANPVWGGSLQDSLTDVTSDTSRIHGWLRDLPPTHEQYTRLTGAWQRYASLAQNSATRWDVLPREVENLKTSGPAVLALKNRLRAEGYWQDEQSEAFGPRLQAAIVEYQRTHQLTEAGWITPETFRSMNVGVERRRDQIRVALQRWRESRIGHDSTFVHVNIPDFHAEVFQDGARAMRFRVVTGATRTRWDATQNENVLVSATPEMSSTIEHVVFNPYWNVPQGLRFSELEPKAKEDPEYFAKQGFEYINDGGRTFLRQNPGPQNALGQVKFMFPNQHDVYLHDTPDKHVFAYPVRAYSHGCVRVDEPMNLARHLVQTASPWKVSDIDVWMNRPSETWIRLTKPIPIHIEYVVVRVDDDGHVHFLADVYQRDQPRLLEVAQRLSARDNLVLPNAYEDAVPTSMVP